MIGIDRATTIGFFSILGSREGHAEKTIVELRSGKIMFYRTDDARDSTLEVKDWFHPACINTSRAWYCATGEAIFSVQANIDGEDRVEVFDGAIEMRKGCPATRLAVEIRGVRTSKNSRRKRSDVG